MAKNKRWKEAKKEECALPACDAPMEQKTEAAPKLDFDAWFASRGPKIPKHHRKEILRADFTARGLGQCESLADFDAALNKYGVKLS